MNVNGTILLCTSTLQTVPIQKARGRQRTMPAHTAAEDGALLLTRDEAATAQWAANRARGSFPTKGCGKGRAPGSEDARQRWRTLLFVCSSCEALVSRARALQHARRTGRLVVLAGDGCASSSCSTDYRNARFVHTQRRYASELHDGSRLLVRPPTATDDRDVWVLPDERARAVSRAVLRRSRP